MTPLRKPSPEKAWGNDMPKPERPEDVSDSEWARLEEMAIEGVRATVQQQSDAALAELDRSRLEKP